MQQNLLSELEPSGAHILATRPRNHGRKVGSSNEIKWSKCCLLVEVQCNRVTASNKTSDWVRRIKAFPKDPTKPRVFTNAHGFGVLVEPVSGVVSALYTSETTARPSYSSALQATKIVVMPLMIIQWRPWLWRSSCLGSENSPETQHLVVFLPMEEE